MATKKETHGTYNCYKDGCYCKKCTAANSQYMQTMRDTKRYNAERLALQLAGKISVTR
jgi:hypothetical protein